MLTTVDADLGTRVKVELTRHGVHVVNGVSVRAIESRSDGQLEIKGSDKFTHGSDMVVVAARPITGLATSSGIPTGLLGAIKVKRNMETDVPHIYAAGDCV